MEHSNRNSGQPNARSVLLVALWFGMVGGLLDGAKNWMIQLLGWVSLWRMAAVDHNLLWGAVLVDVPLFLVVGCLLTPLLLRVTRWPWVVVATGILAPLAFFPLLVVPGRVKDTGMAMLALGLGVTVARLAGRNPERAVRFFRRSLIPVIVVTLVICVGAAAAEAVWERFQRARLPAAAENSPGVLLVVLDTLRADRVGVYGYKRGTTPFLDEFAGGAILFDRAFANSSWSLPSHLSMFTGKMPFEHGANVEPYNGRFPTLAEVLQAKGYLTAGVVANHLACNRPLGMARGFLHWENLFTSVEDVLVRTTYGHHIRHYLAPLLGTTDEERWMRAGEVNARFLKWLDAQPRRPFFVFLNYMDLHKPLYPPREFAARFSTQPEVMSVRHVPLLGPGPNPLFDVRDEIYKDAYDASLAYQDAQLRALFEELERRGLEENLLVIITSDHGESLGEHGLYTHRNSLYIEQLRVPLLIRLPGKKAAGRRVSRLVGLHQVAAAVASVLGIGREQFAGPSLTDNEEGDDRADTAILSELSGGDWSSVPAYWPISKGGMKSLVTARWHFILQENGNIELYDWPNDPQEQNNLAHAPERQELVAEFRARLQQMAPGAAF